MATNVVPGRFGMLLTQVCNIDFFPSGPSERATDCGDAQNGQNRGVQRSGPDDDLIGICQRAFDVGMRLWCGGNQSQAGNTRCLSDCCFTVNFADHGVQTRVEVLEAGLEHDGFHCRWQQTTNCAEHLHRFFDCESEVSEHFCQTRKQQIANGMPIESRGQLWCFETVLQGARPHRVGVRERNDAAPDVTGSREPECFAQMTARPAIIGDRHHPGNSVCVLTNRPQRGGKAVSAAQRNNTRTAWVWGGHTHRL